MIKVFILIFTSLFIFHCSQNDGRNFSSGKSGKKRSDKIEFASIQAGFQLIMFQYKSGLIGKEEAGEMFSNLLRIMNEYYTERSEKLYGFDEWVFPLKGYGPHQIGGTKGSGFISDTTNFFNLEKLRGHPAHDIFIYDDDLNEIDDKTGKPADVLSMTGGVVISTKETWTPDDSSKGGKYIWIYDPAEKAIFYYAHNRKIYVSEGDVVMPGDVIAEVGRTGENAYESRSPTHLHLGMFKIQNGIPKPHNYYHQLVKAKQM